MLRAEIIEDETVRAQFFRYFAVSTVVIFIALFCIWKISIGFWTLIQEFFVILVFFLWLLFLRRRCRSNLSAALLGGLLLPRQSSDSSEAYQEKKDLRLHPDEKDAD